MSSHISLNPIGPNHNEVDLGGGITAVFSYKTLVAVRVGGSQCRTSEYHSRTTSKHLKAGGFAGAKEVSPGELSLLIKAAMN